MQAYQCHYQDYGVFDKCVHFVLMVDLPGIAPGSTMPSLGRDYNNHLLITCSLPSVLDNGVCMSASSPFCCGNTRRQ